MGRVALTFDDGPDELTPRYLELLDDLGVPATFFVLGELANKSPEHIREYLRRGQVAGYGYDHQRFTKLSRRKLLDQCKRTDEAIGGQASGTSWVRPPHGSLDSLSLINLRTSGYTVACRRSIRATTPIAIRSRSRSAASRPRAKCSCSTRARSGRSMRCRGSSRRSMAPASSA